MVEIDHQVRYEVWLGEECMAKLIGRYLLKPALLAFGRWEGAVDDIEVRQALVAQVYSDCKLQKSQLFIPLNDNTEDICAMFCGGGFELEYEKYIFRSELTEIAKPSRSIQFRPHSTLPIEDYQALFQACNVGDPLTVGSAGESPAAFFQRTVQELGPLHFSDGMFVAFRDAAAIGIVHVRLEEDQLGLINYIGLHSDFRGQGLGIDLHRQAMILLREMGCKTYVGSTATTNIPMLKIFRHNQCSLVGRQAYLRVKQSNELQ